MSAPTKCSGRSREAAIPDDTPTPAREGDAGRLRQLREFYHGCGEREEVQRDGIGHCVFLLRLVSERDATIATLRRERDEARATIEAYQGKLVDIRVDRDEAVKQRNEAVATLAERERELREARAAEHKLSDAYLRLRSIIPGSYKTPDAPSPEQVWEITESAATRLFYENKNAAVEARKNQVIAITFKRERDEARAERCHGFAGVCHHKLG